MKPSTLIEGVYASLELGAVAAATIGRMQLMMMVVLHGDDAAATCILVVK